MDHNKLLCGSKNIFLNRKIWVEVVQFNWAYLSVAILANYGEIQGKIFDIWGLHLLPKAFETCILDICISDKV